MSRFATDITADIPGYHETQRFLRSNESIATGRMLMFAALLCMARAALVPWIMKYSGGATRGGPADIDIVEFSVVCMSVFLLCSIWSRFNPMFSALVAILAFIAMTARDVMNFPDLMSQGIIAKPLIAILLIRALMNSVMSKTL